MKIQKQAKPHKSNKTSDHQKTDIHLKNTDFNSSHNQTNSSFQKKKIALNPKMLSKKILTKMKKKQAKK
ncbi:hypothetical protein [Mesomycoplasma hyorhinis]|uniref:hypothetical protein n=1 Tax=Mesomycoplasma hyorhinis TaxID=2100 RepID=UPI001C69310F|nr:hypothetical protein [Mesomycoplasma hyorhinis]